MTPAVKMTIRLGVSQVLKKLIPLWVSLKCVFKMLTILKASALIEKQLSGIN